MDKILDEILNYKIEKNKSLKIINENNNISSVKSFLSFILITGVVSTTLIATRGLFPEAETFGSFLTSLLQIIMAIITIICSFIFIIDEPITDIKRFFSKKKEVSEIKNYAEIIKKLEKEEFIECIKIVYEEEKYNNLVCDFDKEMERRIKSEKDKIKKLNVLKENLEIYTNEQQEEIETIIKERNMSLDSIKIQSN